MQKRTSNFSSQGFGHPFDHIYVYNWLQHVFTCHVFHLLFQKCVLSSKLLLGGDVVFPNNKTLEPTPPCRFTPTQPGHGNAPHQRSASVRVVKLLYHLTVTDGVSREVGVDGVEKREKLLQDCFHIIRLMEFMTKYTFLWKNLKKKTIWKSCVGKRFFHFKLPNALKLKTQIIPTSVGLDIFVLDMGDQKFDAERYDSKIHACSTLCPKNLLKLRPQPKTTQTPWRHESCMFVWFVWGGSIS